jgi:NTP pyrophosphatase (non-canonical NTP hydrolase)
MTGNEFQLATRGTAIYQGANQKTPEAVVYCALGLSGEAGEVSEKLKRLVRKSGFSALAAMDEDTRASIMKEIGDVCWYVARLADELGHDLDVVLRANTEKLLSRKDRGVLHGDGDNR